MTLPLTPTGTHGFTTLSPMAVTPPMCLPDVELGLSSPVSSLSPIQHVLDTPEGSMGHSTGASTPIGSWLWKLDPLLDDNQASNHTLYSSDVSISEAEEQPASIVERLLTDDLQKLGAIPAKPASKSRRSPPKNTCTTYSNTCKEQPLSPRSRMRLWATKHPLTNLPGSELDVPEMVQAPPKGPKLTATMAKTRYSALIMELGIVNSQQYEDHLRQNEELRALERLVQPNQLESTKKLLFRQNYLLRSETYARKFEELSDPTTIVSPHLRGGWLSFLDRIARQNNLSRETLMVSLRHWLMNTNGKKKGLVLIGKSDSGKTFLADCLLSVYDKSDVGYFQCPMGNNVSTFMYANLLNKEVYRCDEFILEHAGVLQSFKQLTEGSSTLQTDVKYKDSTHVDPKPVVVTMNGESREDVVKWFSSELQAVQNRCLILLMDMRLKDMYTNRQLDQLRAGADSLLRMLFTTYVDTVNYEEQSLSEYNDYI